MQPTSEGVSGRDHSLNGKTTISHDEINELPLRAFEGKIELVSQPKEVEHAFHDIVKHKVVGFDTETRPSFHKGQHYHVALLQIALPSKVYLVRLAEMGVTQPIIDFFENVKIQKVGVGVRDDIRALQKRTRFTAEGFVELTTMSREVGLQVESVKKLTALLLGFRISKSAQTSNWEAPILNEKQISYAATDAWVCLEIYKQILARQKMAVSH